MKIGTFRVSSPTGTVNRVGVLAGNLVVDATAARVALLEKQLPPAVADRVGTVQTPPDLIGILEAGPTGLDWVREAADHVSGNGRDLTSGGARTTFSLDEVELVAPLPRPAQISCFATWPAHLEDSATKGFAVYFPSDESGIMSYYKGNPDSVSHSGTELHPPSYSPDIDVECEMAAVVFGGGPNLTTDQARETIAGYCVFNDVSTRTRQSDEMKIGLGPTKGKDWDGANVLGPWLVTADEVGDPQQLRMSLRVNGEEWSSYNTSKMHWGFADMVRYLSTEQTLKAGHVLTSGCYPGGSALDTNHTLVPGDRVELEIERLGVLHHLITSA